MDDSEITMEGAIRVLRHHAVASTTELAEEIRTGKGAGNLIVFGRSRVEHIMGILFAIERLSKS